MVRSADLPVVLQHGREGAHVSTAGNRAGVALKDALAVDDSAAVKDHRAQPHLAAAHCFTALCLLRSSVSGAVVGAWQLTERLRLT